MSSETQTKTLPLQPMHTPNAPSWFPPAWGWWAVVAAIIIALLIVWLVVRWKKKRLAPKKTALRLLSCEGKPSEAIELVRQAALCYFPREEIAKLTGDKWYQFLDSQLNTPRFTPNQEMWQQVLYKKQPVTNAETLIQDCRDWVEQALPPKRRSA